jgi:hypothetical protein
MRNTVDGRGRVIRVGEASPIYANKCDGLRGKLFENEDYLHPDAIFLDLIILAIHP